MSHVDKRWDVVVRGCHWAMVLLVVLMFATGQFGWLDIDWHAYFGYTLLAVLALRLSWGFIGPPSARFGSSLFGPSALLDYLRHFRQRKAGSYVAHNPLGALAVFALWGVLLVQGVTGLFSSDDIMFDGPLLQYLPGWESFATGLHHQLKIVLMVLVALHLLAITTYWFVKRENLVGPMLHGRAETAPVVPPAPTPTPDAGQLD
ncbi:hypothetical protein C7S18_14935 [Ahniella affigens]|uniref:Cytochrome b561 bacterial/Ni-hydrogenase domain-containing protein n=1 Tax=Ahniella affigens TaxID=2021234 RepID=A0A2P1PU83_9GAMM|nr:cytochrome b/b6 domain-containing protein [Ahniella affigens]AVP98403.1 hypothetical protein C7S18_14935 [Ahniella affigens]